MPAEISPCTATSTASPLSRSSASTSIDPDRPPLPLPRSRPSSARASLVNQKLQQALQSAERTGANLTKVQSQASLRPRSATATTTTTTSTVEVSERNASFDRSVSRYRNDAAIVSFNDSSSTFSYSSTFMPGVHFYSFLAAASANTPTAASTAAHKHNPNQPLRMWVPDTIVYGETGQAIWIYSDDEGNVQRLTEFTEKMVLDRFCSPGTELDPVVVCKEPMIGPANRLANNNNNSSALSYQGNLLRLMNHTELKTLLSSVSTTRNGKSFAIQKFIKCNGSKAFIVRSIYEAGKPHYAWMINNTTLIQDPTPTVSQVWLSLGQEVPGTVGGTGTLTSGGLSPLGRSSSVTVNESTTNVAANDIGNGTTLSSATTTSTLLPPTSSSSTSTTPLVNRLCTSVQVDKSCTFMKLNERGCIAISELNQSIVKYIEHRLHLQLQTFVADFVKDMSGKWWLLQVKAFRVKKRRRVMTGSSTEIEVPDKMYSLPLKLRLQYLGYRDSSVLEENTDSEDEHERHAAQHAAQLAQRQIRKLVQCKCCLAAYPKGELSFKMTLKMINEMLVRVRSRLPPEKSYTFLSAALAREPPDASLAYESWSVCSYCYAIYERDQQLMRIETRFAHVLGIPQAQTAVDGLSKIQDRTFGIDPNSSAMILPPQLTLCRLMLVINGIYDIPQDLYDAEQQDEELDNNNSEKQQRIPVSGPSRLFLRITSLGYTECIPIDPRDIREANEKAPRGARLRKSSMSSVMYGDDDDEMEDERHGTGGDGAIAREREPGSAESSTQKTGNPGQKNYWLPINLIRTIHFFAPRTPLQAKLKETSGLTPFLNEDNSIIIQFIRATEPPLHDPVPPNNVSKVVLGEGLGIGGGIGLGLNRGVASTATSATPLSRHARRAALTPHAQALSDTMGQIHTPNHSILLGATKIRMAQFRSAYVTKIDFYACMALSGEMFNMKGNIGLQRVRYVDTKLLTTQYRLRSYNGVFIPDDSYMPCDALSSEWMDCLRTTINPHASKSRESAQLPTALASTHPTEPQQPPQEQPTIARELAPIKTFKTVAVLTPRTDATSIHRSASTALLSQEMDQELEQMLERADHDAKHLHLHLNGQSSTRRITTPRGTSIVTTTAAAPPAVVPQVTSITALKDELLPTTEPTSNVVAQLSMLMNKSVLSPRSELANVVTDEEGLSPPNLTRTQGLLASSVHDAKSLWRFVILLNHAHNLQSRERPFCRWECHYGLFGQRRSAVERSTTSSGNSPPRQPGAGDGSPPRQAKPSDNEVSFSCTHTFYLSGTTAMLHAHMRWNRHVTLHLRNDVYASTRSQRSGEYFAVLDLSKVLHTKTFDVTLDIQPTNITPLTELTPREAALVAHAPPYLSASVQLTQLNNIDPDEAVLKGDFVVVGSTPEGMHVLKKIA